MALVPTRELAVQVRGEFEKLAQGRRIHCVALYGGKPIRRQVEQLRRGADVVIGTPGRVLDHLGRKSLDLRSLDVVVLEEGRVVEQGSAESVFARFLARIEAGEQPSFEALVGDHPQLADELRTLQGEYARLPEALGRTAPEPPARELRTSD